MPMVSIIVPVYNAERLIGRCVESVLAQDFRDFELILVDDGSTDGSGALLDAYAEADARVRVFHRENAGVSNTRNFALSIAGGQYIQFSDADDWMVPEATGALVRAAEQSGAGLVIADFYRVIGNRTAQKGSIEEDGLISRLRFAEFMTHSPADYYYGALWNKLYRRQILEAHAISMDERLQWAEDFIFNMEYILHIESVYVLRVPLYYYVKTEGGLVSKGMNLPDIVRMKLNVIEYYTTFYKNIYNQEDYAAKRPVIYGFLLDFAHDDGVIPGLPRTRKLGTERTTASQNAILWDLWTEHYYERRLLERNLRNIALQTGLDIKELRILLYLQHFGGIENLRELAEYVGVSQLVLIATLEGMALKKVVAMDLAKPATARLGDQSAKALRLLESAIASVQEAAQEGMEAPLLEGFNATRKRAAENYRQRLEY